MALTNAEKVRAYRERKKAKREVELKKPASDAAIMRTPFFEWIKEDSNWMDFEMALDQAGIEIPQFDDDADAKSSTGEIERLFFGNPEDSPYVVGTGSLGRAEMMVGCLISATVHLAGVVNDYKQSEIKARIAEIEQADLSDPIAKKQALADIVRLQKMLDQLGKQVRWTFPQWKVTGE